MKCRISEDILTCISIMVTQNQNSILESIPTMDELRSVVFAMNWNSAPGPDGIVGKFCQSYFDNINNELLVAVSRYA